MESNRTRIGFWLFLIPLLTLAQGSEIKDEAHKYKLDYNVPESPAFSILDANPTTIMRANSAQELVINLATNFINNNGVDPGLAIDFNPFFVFGGRLKSVNDYRDSYASRLLANTQLSIASISSDIFPEDQLISGAIRMTLFDSKDMLFDKELSSDIDKALTEFIPPPPPPGSDPRDEVVKNPALTKAYEDAKARYRKSKGGSVSLGYAIAGRALNVSFKTDSILTYRHQAWLVGQYDLGSTKMSLNGMVMYRYENGISEDIDGIIAGFGLRHYGEKVILTGEFVYDEIIGEVGFGAYIEFYALPNISVYASIGKDNSSLNTSNDYVFKPGVKWNLSEPKK